MRVLTCLAISASFVLSNPLPLSAHAALDISQATPGSVWRGVLRIAHGCAGSPTTTLALDVPESLTQVKPQPKPGWTVAVKRDGDRISHIIWSGGSLPDDQFDEFVFRARVSPNLAVGTALPLPVVQTCQQGQERWVEVAEPGQDARSLESPAPLLRIVAAADQSGALVIAQGWTRATPKAAPVASGYLTITNKGGIPDRLLSVSTPVAGRSEIHEMTQIDGIMRMRSLEGGLPVASGETVILQPGGLHLMLMELKAPLREGDDIPLTLVFEKAGAVSTILRTLGPGARGLATDPHAGHPH